MKQVAQEAKLRNVLKAKYDRELVIRKKYLVVPPNQTTKKLLQNRKISVKRVISVMTADKFSIKHRMEAQSLIPRVFYSRDRYIKNVEQTFKSVKKKVELMLARVEQVPIKTDNMENAVAVLCRM